MWAGIALAISAEGKRHQEMSGVTRDSAVRGDSLEIFDLAIEIAPFSVVVLSPFGIMLLV